MKELFRALLRPGTLIRLVIALVAGALLWGVIDWWIGDRTSILLDWLPTRDITLLSPQWLFLFAVVPVFYLLRIVSLTDLSITQQIVQATLRSLTP